MNKTHQVRYVVQRQNGRFPEVFGWKDVSEHDTIDEALHGEATGRASIQWHDPLYNWRILKRTDELVSEMCQGAVR